MINFTDPFKQVSRKSDFDNKFAYFGVTVTNTNDIREEIKRRVNMGNA